MYTQGFTCLEGPENVLWTQTPRQSVLLARCKEGTGTCLAGPATSVTTHLVPTTFGEKKNLTCGFIRLLAGDAFERRLTAVSGQEHTSAVLKELSVRSQLKHSVVPSPHPFSVQIPVH